MRVHTGTRRRWHSPQSCLGVRIDDFSLKNSEFLLNRRWFSWCNAGIELRPSQVNCALKVMDFAFKIMNLAFKMMDFAFKMMDFAFGMMDFAISARDWWGRHQDHRPCSRSIFLEFPVENAEMENCHWKTKIFNMGRPSSRTRIPPPTPSIASNGLQFLRF